MKKSPAYCTHFFQRVTMATCHTLFFPVQNAKQYCSFSALRGLKTLCAVPIADLSFLGRKSRNPELNKRPNRSKIRPRGLRPGSIGNLPSSHGPRSRGERRSVSPMWQRSKVKSQRSEETGQNSRLLLSHSRFAGVERFESSDADRVICGFA